MARTVGSHGPRTSEAILRAGVELIYLHGYEAVSLRRLAQEVGIQQGSLYNHIQSKQDLLVRLVVGHLEDLLDKAEEALADAPDPTAAMKAFIAFHIRHHVPRRRETFIANSELRSLELENRKRVVGLRRRYEGKLIQILEALAVNEPRVVAYSILAMLTGVVDWYRPDGRLSQEALIQVQTELVLAGVGRR